MKKNNTNTDDLREKILKGIEKAVKKLLKLKKESDGELVFSKQGHIFRVKAKEIN
jgi:hypothetical protein